MQSQKCVLPAYLPCVETLDDVGSNSASDVPVVQPPVAPGKEYSDYLYWDPQTKAWASNFGDSTLHLGANASAGDNSVALGTYATTDNLQDSVHSACGQPFVFCVAVGSNATTFQDGSVAVGPYAYTSPTDLIPGEAPPGSISVGAMSSCSGAANISIGLIAATNGIYDIAQGFYTYVEGEDSIAVGNTNRIHGDHNAVLGSGVGISGDANVVLGLDAYVDDVIYRDATGDVVFSASGSANIVGGYQAASYGQDSIVLGTLAYSTGGQTSLFEELPAGGFNIVLGVEANVVGSLDIAQGFQAAAYGDANIAVGTNAAAVGIANIAVGTDASSQGEVNIVLGAEAAAYGGANTAIGIYCTLEGEANSAMGPYATVIAGNGNVVLGPGSLVDGLYVPTEGDPIVAVTGDCNVVAGCDASACGQCNIVQGSNASAVGIVPTGYSGGFFPDSRGGFNVVLGTNASALGDDNVVLGTYSSASGLYIGEGEAVFNQNVSIGYDATSVGTWNTTIGSDTTSYGFANVMAGYSSSVTGIASVVIGTMNSVESPLNFSAGGTNIVVGDFVQVIGYDNNCHGVYADVYGVGNTVLGNYTSVCGAGNIVVNSNTFDETYSSASGAGNILLGSQTNVEGYNMLVLGNNIGTTGIPGSGIVLNGTSSSITAKDGSFLAQPVREVVDDVIPSGWHTLIYNPSTAEIAYYTYTPT